MKTVAASSGNGDDPPATQVGASDLPPDGRLTACALVYLALPNLLFLLGWFRIGPALLLLAVAVYLLAAALRVLARPASSAYAPTAFLVILLTSALWSVFGGGSHFMYANPDWEIRDAVLGDLIHTNWPVYYFSAAGEPLILRSAIGFFLPMAVFGKWFGLAHLDLAVYFWTVAGVLLFLLLLPLPGRVGWRLALSLALAVFFSGMDLVGQFIATESWPEFPLRMEWWAPLSYPSLTNQLLWAPNHCLPIWIVTLLYWRHRQRDELFQVMAAALSLSLIWTPFAAPALLPFAALAAITAVRRHGWGAIPWTSCAAALVFALPLSAFLLTDAAPIQGSLTRASSPAAPGTGYALQPFSAHTYALFVCCEFLFLALVLAPHVRRDKIEFWLAVFILLALPFVRLGPSNDLGLRLSTPALIVLLIVSLDTLLGEKRLARRSTLWIACLFLLIGAHTAFNELWRAATFPRRQPDYQQTLAERQGGQPAAHYVGRVDASSALGRWLLRPVPKTAISGG